MSDKFLNLNSEKQAAILKAALKEFASQGYDKASTDTISNNAGISKGSLFNYFTNKLNLYLYILEYAITTVNEEALEEINKIKDNDFYDRLKKISIIKHENFIKYPLETKIITTFFITPPKGIGEPLEKFQKYYEIDYNILEKYLIQYLDEEKLRPGITKEDVLFITSVVFEALLKRHVEISAVKSNNQLLYQDEKMLDFDKYIEVLKRGVYNI